MSIAARLNELGIELPSVVPPVASYVPAVVHGDLVYTSGQLPMVSGALPATGKVGEGTGWSRHPTPRTWRARAR
jgi:enamine deaminase RidA (YjgF/YER057c/UK114 family)